MRRRTRSRTRLQPRVDPCRRALLSVRVLLLHPSLLLPLPLPHLPLLPLSRSLQTHRSNLFFIIHELHLILPFPFLSPFFFFFSFTKKTTEGMTASSEHSKDSEHIESYTPVRTLVVCGPRALSQEGFEVVRLPRWSYRVASAPASLAAAPTALYARTRRTHTLCELQHARRSADVCGSWLLPGALVADGRALVATPVPPLLVLLPLLRSTRFVEADELLPRSLLAACFGADAAGAEAAAAALAAVCDTQDLGDTRVYRPSAARTLAWLVARVHAITADPRARAALRRGTEGRFRTCATGCVAESLLRARGEVIPGGPAKKEGNEEEEEERAVRAEALAVLAEYITGEWLARVAEALGMPGFVVPTATTPAAPATIAAAEAKNATARFRKGGGGASRGGGGAHSAAAAGHARPSTRGAPAKRGRAAAAAAAAPAAPSGCANISSFFLPVSKK